MLTSPARSLALCAITLCTSSLRCADAPAGNIAPAAEVTVSSWLETMTGDHLVNGNRSFIWRKDGWRSGTRFPAPAGVFRQEPITFDFHRSLPAEIEGVGVFGRSPLLFAVDVWDQGSWREVATNASAQPAGPPSQILRFAPVPAHSVRVRLLGHAVQKDAEHYILGEIEIYGTLRGKNLAAGLEVDMGTPAERTFPQGQRVTLPLRLSWRSLPAGFSPQDFSAQVTVGKRYGDRAMKVLQSDVSSAPSLIDLGPLAPGAYRVELQLRVKTSGAVIRRETTTVGVIDPRWEKGETTPQLADASHYTSPLGIDASARMPRAWLRGADVNGLDSIHDIPDIDYYLQAVRDSGAVAEIFLPWGSLEPLPGVFDFDLADRWFTAAAKYGLRLRVNLNPPLAGNLPAWLEADVLHEQFLDGRNEPVQMASLFSPTVRQHAPRLWRLLMTRYGQHPAAGLWVLNINGEYLWRIHANRYEDASPWALRAYRKDLATRYSSIENLNAAWHRHYAAFEDIPLPERGANLGWTTFCDFMLRETTAFYEPIAASAREILGDKAILLTTAGHLAAEPFVSFARKYQIWQSNHSQENPQFLGWASLWRSHGVTCFGEPGFVNVEMLDVNRTFFLSAVGGLVHYTYRQYNWPNPSAWVAFGNQQKLGDKLVNATPMRSDFVLAGMFETGLVAGSNTFSVGSVWIPVGSFYDACLKIGALPDFYDGHNPSILQSTRAVVELGSVIFPDAAITDLSRYVADGGRLILFPQLTGTAPRRVWTAPDDTRRDVLLEKIAPSFANAHVSARTQVRAPGGWLAGLPALTSTGAWLPDGKLPDAATVLASTSSGTPAILQWPCGQGTVTAFPFGLPDRIVPGNDRRGPGGTGWNHTFTNPETIEFIKLLMKDIGIRLPFTIASDQKDTWSCGFENGPIRYILLYNNHETLPATVSIGSLDPARFPATTYRASLHHLAVALQEETLPEQDTDRLQIKATVPPYGLCLVELTPP
ncbi:hypothetical protein DB345_02745 [Spartobacteria bacterium LR76]|nr:hypothetical protein DB345_02745 [Spartobacteria bacterium LR76]